MQLRTTSGLHVDGRSGRTALESLMDRLAGLVLVDHGSFTAAANAMAADRGGNSLAIITTGFARSDDLASVAVMKKRFDVLSVINMRPGDVGAGGASPAIAGAIAIEAATGADFANAWNTWVSR